jgi:hypothetical protein
VLEAFKDLKVGDVLICAPHDDQHGVGRRRHTAEHPDYVGGDIWPWMVTEEKAGGREWSKMTSQAIIEFKRNAAQETADSDTADCALLKHIRQLAKTEGAITVTWHGATKKARLLYVTLPDPSLWEAYQRRALMTNWGDGRKGFTDDSRSEKGLDERLRELEARIKRHREALVRRLQHG